MLSRGKSSNQRFESKIVSRGKRRVKGCVKGFLKNFKSYFIVEEMANKYFLYFICLTLKETNFVLHYLSALKDVRLAYGAGPIIP